VQRDPSLNPVITHIPIVRRRGEHLALVYSSLRLHRDCEAVCLIQFAPTGSLPCCLPEFAAPQNMAQHRVSQVSYLCGRYSAQFPSPSSGSNN